ncbi:hypothetical protein GC425_05445 [Corynebacterium sp. zg254]|uniref:Acetylxylan esterase n=1 Tax=Corynebacterium zhongnanshanii TaxID=2768834 RepID=A0ABQ6VH23_9CORY|nr:acetylxylan esterase [Corynebacterium zhongnanshanii]MCR5914309.1 hypothetical protein [Corynebacterium sp. zg254]
MISFSLRRRGSRITASLAAASVLFTGVAAPGVVSPPSAQAQSSEFFGSIADITPGSLVKSTPAMADVRPYSKPTADSGLRIPNASEAQGRTGVPLGEVDLDPMVGLAQAAVQKRFVYSTTNQHGEVATSTGAVFLPAGPAPEGGWPVLAWAHGTVGLGDQCAPSINQRSPRDAEYLNHWLSQGYAIVATDYAGQGTPGLMSYLNGQAEADSVVDSVIAARALGSMAKDGSSLLSHRWAVIGQSQGGGAALQVARLATQRSTPAGLDFRGTVATGAPAYVEEIVAAGGPTFPPVTLPTGLNVYALYILAALREARPDIDVNSALNEQGRRMVDAAETACLGELSEAMKGVNIAHGFSKPLRSVPGLVDAARSMMATPAYGYDRPVFVGHGLKDMDVPTPIGLLLNTDMWFQQFNLDARARNTRVEVRWYPTNHGDTVFASVPDSTPFLRSIFN